MSRTHFYWKLFMCQLVSLESWEESMKIKLRELLIAVIDGDNQASIYHEHSEFKRWKWWIVGLKVKGKSQVEQKPLKNIVWCLIQIHFPSYLIAFVCFANCSNLCDFKFQNICSIINSTLIHDATLIKWLTPAFVW